MDNLFIQAAQLGGTVFVTVAFLWYLAKRDKDLTKMMSNHLEHQQKSDLKLAKSLQKLTDVIIQFHKAINGK